MVKATSVYLMIPPTCIAFKSYMYMYMYYQFSHRGYFYLLVLYLYFICRLNDIEYLVNSQSKESEGPKNWPAHYPEIKGGKKGDVYKLVSALLEHYILIHNQTVLFVYLNFSIYMFPES